MATIKPISVPAKRLAQTITGSASSFKLDNILGWDGVTDLAASDFGTKAYAAFRNSAGTLIEFMEIDPSTIASASITILYRGLAYNGDNLTTEVAANKLTWVKGDTIVELGTHMPQLLAHYVDIVSAQTIAGVKTFSSLPTIPLTPVATTDAASKSYVDLVGTGSATTNKVTVAGTAGETLAAGNLVYLKTTDSRWWLCDADTAATVNNVILGIVQGAGTAGGAVTGGVLIKGVDTNQTGLTANTVYYASNTAGGISSSVGTTEVTVGVALSTTSLIFEPRYNQMLTEDEQDALTGDAGTPSASNRFITEQSSLISPSGAIIMWGAPTMPTGWLKCDGTAVSRTTYATLFGILNPSLGAVTVTIASPGVFSLTGHGLVEGDIVYLTTTGALPTGLAVNTIYYVISAGLTANAFEVSATRGGAAINTSGTQSGVHTLRRSAYGIGDGSTTFNLPDMRGNMPVGEKPTDTVFALGETGGAKTHSITQAELPALNFLVSGGNSDTRNVSAPDSNYGATQAGSGTAMSILNPYMTLHFIIKT